MEEEHTCSSPSSTFNPFWFTYASLLNSSIRSATPKVRHNFKSIDKLLSPSPCGNSQLSISIQSQETDDDIENVKPKKNRTAFTDDQKQYLDRYYSTNRYPDPTQLERISHILSLNEKVIRVWFQNKRSRDKTHPRNILH